MRTRRRAAGIALAGVTAVLAACGSSEPGPVSAVTPSLNAGGVPPPAPSGEDVAGAPAFIECAGERGLDFTWQSGHAGRHLNPEIVGGGVALIDHDGDGDLDVYFVQGGPVTAPIRDGDRLFRNDGRGHFTDVTDSAGIRDAAFGMGAAVGDVDNDGDDDLYVTNLGPNVLWRNDGGRFTDVTAEAGVGEPSWSSSAAFFDLEGDGDLDLYVCNYISWAPGRERACAGPNGEPDYCHPGAYQAPARDTLYRNRGDGVFEDVTSELGIDTALGTGLGVTCADWDGDGRMEIFVANDGMMNHLWVMGSDGRFEERALRRGCATGEAGQVKAGMGVATGDLDGDGDGDLLAVNLRRETDSLFLNEGAWFRDATATWRLATPSRRTTRFGTGFADFDQDGRLDLFHSNGGVQRLPLPRSDDDPYAEPNALFRGIVLEEGKAAFTEWAPAGGTAPPIVRTSRAAAFGDLDGDLAIDLLVINRDAPASLLLNVIPERGNALLLDVRETCGRQALGAEVLVHAGGRSIRRDVVSAYGYCTANDPRVHVGLGDADIVDSIEVRWADGVRERFPGGPVNVARTLRRGRPGA